MIVSGFEYTTKLGSKVFVGKCPEVSESVYLRFQSPEGDERRIRLSKEAADVLGVMLTGGIGGAVEQTYVSNSYWTVAKPIEIEQTGGSDVKSYAEAVSERQQDREPAGPGG